MVHYVVTCTNVQCLNQELIRITDYLVLLLILLVTTLLFKKAEDSIISNQIEMKFLRIVLEVNVHRLLISDVTSYFLDGVDYIISCRKVLDYNKM